MYYIFTIQKDIDDKPTSETYICDRLLFGDVELLGYELCGGPGDVTFIERSIVREIVNTRTADYQEMYIATLTQVYVDDSGKEKKFNYQVLAYAESLDDATSIFQEYMKQGFEDMTLTALKKTKILDYIE